MARLLQYQEQVSGIPSALAPERTTPDKWQPTTNIPQSNWQKAALYSAAAIMPFFTISPWAVTQKEVPKVYAPQSVVITQIRTTQYQGLAYPVAGFSPKERTTPDEWYRETERPIPNRPNSNWLSGLVNPLRVAENISVDKWFRDSERPLFSKRNTPFDTSVQPFKQQDSITVPVNVSYGVVFTQNLQYQALTKPPQQTQAETITADKWCPDTEIPTPDVKRHQFLYPSLFIDANQLAQEEAVSSDKWQPNTNQPVFDKKKAQWTNQFFAIDNRLLTQPERSTPDKWQPETNKPLFDVKRQQHTYPFAFFHPEPQEVTQFESPSEFARNVDKVFNIARNQYLYPSLAIDAKQLTQPERVSFDKWNFNQAIPRFDVARNQHFYPTSVFNPYPIEQGADLQLAGIRQTNVPYFPIKHTEYLYPSFAIDPSQLTQRERVTLDKWVRPVEQPRFDVSRNQHTYPTAFFNPYPLPNTEVLTLDKWNPRTNVPLFDVKKWQFTYPFFFTDSKHLLDHESITVDKWFVPVNQPLIVRPRVIDTQLGPIVVQEIVTVDKWFQPIIQPERQPQGLMSGETLLVPVQLRTDLLTWLKETNQPIFVQKNTAYIPYLVAQYCTGNPWFLTDRSTDDSYNLVSRNSDASYNETSRSSDDTYASVNRSSDDSFNEVSRDSDDSYHKINREC